MRHPEKLLPPVCAPMALQVNGVQGCEEQSLQPGLTWGSSHNTDSGCWLRRRRAGSCRGTERNGFCGKN